MSDRVVYLHKLNGEIVYVGSGSVNRVRSKNGRSKEHISMWDALEKVIVAEKLSITDSRKLESDFIEKYSTSKLLNRKKVDSVHEINWKILSQYFKYDESSPSFISRICKTSHNSSNGCLTAVGYYVISFNNKSYKSHRIIWSIVNKSDIPDGYVIDHIDGNKSNNHISNLRCVSQSDNTKNKKHAVNSLGYQCIYLSNKNYFCVRHQVDCKTISKQFSFSKIRKTSKNHYQTRELAFEAALAYRNSLVEQGLIILTNKEEPDGIN